MNKFLAIVSLTLLPLFGFAAEVPLAQLIYCQSNAEVVYNQAAKLRDKGLSKEEAIKTIGPVLVENGVDQASIKLTWQLLDYVYSSTEDAVDTAISWFNACMNNPKI